MSLLTLQDVEVRRSGKTILAIDNLTIDDGESIAVLGPNGSGKTTLVNLVTREVFPLHREVPPVVFRDKPRMTLAEAKQCTGAISSSMTDQIRVHLPAIDVVIGGIYGSLGIPLRKKATEEQRNRAFAVMRELGIEDLAPRDILTMSTGQVRRVLAARALINNPDILVFDEPCTGLDPEGMFYIRRTMRKLAQEGRSILLVTHYLEDIVPEIDHVILLKEGAIFAQGTKEEMLTSTLMGELFDIPDNLITIEKSDGHYVMNVDY